MDAYAANELAERLARQGWDQGSLLPFRRQLLLTDPANPVSELAAGALAKAKQRDTDGEPVSIVFVRPEQQVGAILVTQVCDLVADPAAEPNCEAMPIIELGADDGLPQPNSTRAFLLDAEKRWVVDATHRLQFEKSLIPDADAEQLLSPEQQRLFAAWLGRRSTRARWPNDFEMTVSAALKHVLAKSGFRNRPAYPHLHPLRAAFAPEDQTKVFVLMPFDELHVTEEDAASLGRELLEQARERLPRETAKARKRVVDAGTGEEVRDFEIVNLRVTGLDRLTLRVMLTAPPLNLEHLTYGRTGIFGAEPHAELEA